MALLTHGVSVLPLARTAPKYSGAPTVLSLPTIFAQRLADGRMLSAPLLVGTRGVSAHAIDLFPSIAIGAHDEVWCAWDATGHHKARCILVNQGQPGGVSFGRETRLSD